MAHHPNSPGGTSDDKRLADDDGLRGREVVVTAKLDGEQATLTRDGVHARSPDSGYSWSRTRVAAVAGGLRHLVPEGWRICGENLQARHRIAMHDLPAPFFVHVVFDPDGVAVTWEETLGWAARLGIPAVPELWRGRYDRDVLLEVAWTPPPFADEAEGAVIRIASAIAPKEWARSICKLVRAGHVPVDAEHWTRGPRLENSFAGDSSP